MKKLRPENLNDKPRATQPALCQTRTELQSSSTGIRREKNGSTELWQSILNSFIQCIFIEHLIRQAGLDPRIQTKADTVPASTVPGTQILSNLTQLTPDSEQQALEERTRKEGRVVLGLSPRLGRRGGFPKEMTSMMRREARKRKVLGWGEKVSSRRKKKYEVGDKRGHLQRWTLSDPFSLPLSPSLPRTWLCPSPLPAWPCCHLGSPWTTCQFYCLLHPLPYHSLSPPTGPASQHPSCPQ